MMADGNEWMAQARRWPFGRDTGPYGAVTAELADDDPALAAIGYESAFPALQHGWTGAAPEIR